MILGAIKAYVLCSNISISIVHYKISICATADVSQEENMDVLHVALQIRGLAPPPTFKLKT
jgi:hypothetical protein